MTIENHRKFVTGIMTAWFVFAVSVSALHVFHNPSGRLGLSVAFAALAPIVVFLAWFAASARFRQFVLSLSPRTLTLAQAWRINGFVFLVLYGYGLLPGVFALPAGWGDMAVGATALLVARYLAFPRYRAGFILWHALGMADLVMAVTLGTTAGALSSPGPSTEVMTVLPLSLVPTFLVPLLMILHIVCIAQARRWSHQGEEAREGQLFTPAA